MTDGNPPSLDDVRRGVAQVRADHDDYLSRLAEVGGDREQPAANAPTVLADTTLPDETRVEVLERMPATIAGRGGDFETLLAVAGDRDDSPDVRAAALDLLATAAFQVALFAPYRPRYDDLLRGLLTDPDPRLRWSAAGSLAHAHDAVLQDVLRRGLRGEAEMPVERFHAIRLLAADDHLDNLPWLREMYRDGDAEARLDAVRYMGSYPDARGDLEAVLQDRAESATVRQQAGSSLRYLAPERFDALAKEIAVDATDDTEVRTACLTTLRYFGDPDRVHDDEDFAGRVRGVAEDESAPQLAGAARGLLDQRSGQ